MRKLSKRITPLKVILLFKHFLGAIFLSICSNQESDDIGVLIVINISEDEVDVDFTSIMPWMPDVAVVRAATSRDSAKPRLAEG